jgi:hypothetical protein
LPKKGEYGKLKSAEHGEKSERVRNCGFAYRRGSRPARQRKHLDERFAFYVENRLGQRYGNRFMAYRNKRKGCVYTRVMRHWAKILAKIWPGFSKKYTKGVDKNYW